jgi:hypothetical protein
MFLLYHTGDPTTAGGMSMIRTTTEGGDRLAAMLIQADAEVTYLPLVRDMAVRASGSRCQFDSVFASVASACAECDLPGLLAAAEQVRKEWALLWSHGPSVAPLRATLP